MVVNVVTELAREDVLRELRYAGDLVLMCDSVEHLRNKF